MAGSAWLTFVTGLRTLVFLCSHSLPRSRPHAALVFLICNIKNFYRLRIDLAMADLYCIGVVRDSPPMSRIISNYQLRPMFQLCELDSQTQARIRAEFDWVDDSKTEMFFRFRGEWYCMSEFSRLEGDLLAKGWQGYLGETAWSSIIIKIVNSCNDLIIGRCICD